MIKKIVLFVIMVFLPIFVIGEIVYGDGDYEPIIDNITPLSDIRLPEYSINELQSFFGKMSLNEVIGFGNLEEFSPLTILEVNKQFPIKCLRGSGSRYTIYKVKEGGYFYVFWIFPSGDRGEDMKTLRVYFTVYLDSLKKEGEFTSIKPAISTAQDVYEVDPAVEFYFGASSGPRTYSLLENGKIVRIIYERCFEQKDKQGLLVKEVDIVSRDENSCWLATILPEDLPVQEKSMSRLIFIVFIPIIVITGAIVFKRRSKDNDRLNEEYKV